jgi:hypothetical protein
MNTKISTANKAASAGHLGDDANIHFLLSAMDQSRLMQFLEVLLLATYLVLNLYK